MFEPLRFDYYRSSAAKNPTSLYVFILLMSTFAAYLLVSLDRRQAAIVSLTDVQVFFSHGMIRLAAKNQTSLYVFILLMSTFAVY